MQPEPGAKTGTVRELGKADNVRPAPEVLPATAAGAGRRAHRLEQHQVHGVILAGGRSSRMGCDKALLQLGGSPLIEHALHILRRAGAPASISGSRGDLEHLAPVLADAEPQQGPLAGICSALRAVTETWVVVLTVDMPLVPPVLIDGMLDVAIQGDYAALIPSHAGLLYPFPCVLHRDMLQGLQAAQRAGEHGCLRAFAAAARALGKPVIALDLDRVRAVLPEAHPLPIATWLLNLNRPEDAAEAERWMVRSAAR